MFSYSFRYSVSLVFLITCFAMGDEPNSLTHLLKHLKQVAIPKNKTIAVEFLHQNTSKILIGKIKQLTINHSDPPQSVFKVEGYTMEESVSSTIEFPAKDLFEVSYDQNMFAIRGNKFRAFILPKFTSRWDRPKGNKYVPELTIHAQVGSVFAFRGQIAGTSLFGIARWLPSNRFRGFLIGSAKEVVNGFSGSSRSTPVYFNAAKLSGAYDSQSKSLNMSWKPTEEYIRYSNEMVYRTARKQNITAKWNYPKLEYLTWTTKKRVRRNSGSAKVDGGFKIVTTSSNFVVGKTETYTPHKPDPGLSLLESLFKTAGKKLAIAYSKFATKEILYRSCPDLEKKSIDTFVEAVFDILESGEAKTADEFEGLVNQKLNAEITKSKTDRLLKFFSNVESSYRSLMTRDREGIDWSDSNQFQNVDPNWIFHPGLSREFSDVSGQHKIQALMIDVDDDRVTLYRSDGKKIDVAINKLSIPDREWVKTEGKGLLGIDTPTIIPSIKRKNRVNQEVVLKLGGFENGSVALFGTKTPGGFGGTSYKIGALPAEIKKEVSTIKRLATEYIRSTAKYDRGKLDVMKQKPN